MIKDIVSRQNDIKERVQELVKLCQNDATKNINLQEKIRNKSQSILNDEVKLLDNLANLVFEIYFAAKYSEHDQKAKIERKVYFPYASNRVDLDKRLKDMKMENLCNIQSDIYNIIEKYQPYNTGEEWLKHLNELSNLGHRKLVPIEKQTSIKTPIGTFSTESENIEISNVSFVEHGYVGHIDNLNIKNGEVTGFDPNIMCYQVQYVVEDYELDIIRLCIESMEKIEKIIREFEKYIDK